jgi:hypothetical protein
MKHTACLRGLIRRHIRRLSKSAIVSGVTTAVGFSLLWILTTILGAEGSSAALVNLGLSLPMTLFGFITTWLLVWDDREITAKAGLGRWTTKSLLLGGFSQISFFVLVGVLGFEHMVIAAVLIIVKMPFGYILNHEWVFKETPPSEMA